MPEKRILQRLPPATSLVRKINALFDSSMVIGYSTGESSPIPEEVLETKMRLLAGVEGAVTGAASDVGWLVGRLEGENTWLQLENNLLRRHLSTLEERVAKLEESALSERVVLLRDVSREEAKQQIRELFATERTLYYSDIAEELGLRLPLVVEICKELRDAGEIGVDAGVLPT